MAIHTNRFISVKNKWKVRIIDIFAAWMIFCLFPPEYFFQFLSKEFFAVMTMVGLIVIIGLMVIYRYMIDSAAILWGIFALWLTFSCAVNGLSPLNGLYNPARVITFILLNQYFMVRKDDMFLKLIRHYMTVILLITFSLQMIDQDMFGYTQSHNFNTFFVSDNYLNWYYMPYITICVIDDFIEKNKIRPITVIETGLCFASLIRSWVAKAIVGMVIIAVYLVFIYHKPIIAKAFNIKTLVSIYIFVFIVIVFVGVADFALTAPLLDFLEKDITFSGRTYIWLSAMQNIANSPIYGHGVQSGGELFINYGRYGRRVIYPAHNIFLEITCQAGIVGLVIYIIMVSLCFYRGCKALKSNMRYYHEYSFLLLMIFVIYFVAIFSQPVYIPMFYMPLILFSSFNSVTAMHDKRFSAEGKNIAG